MDDKKTELKYPAKYLAHWPTGAVAVCEEHCNQIVKLGVMMGAKIPVSFNGDEDLQCKNCINENKIKN